MAGTSSKIMGTPSSVAGTSSNTVETPSNIAGTRSSPVGTPSNLGETQAGDGESVLAAAGRSNEGRNGLRRSAETPSL